MATTPPTSISSSYQRIGGSTPVITQGTPGPRLSAATQERLRLAEQRKLEEERALAEQRRKANQIKVEQEQRQKAEAARISARFGLRPGEEMSPYQLGKYSAEKQAQEAQKAKEQYEGYRMASWNAKR